MRRARRREAAGRPPATDLYGPAPQAFAVCTRRAVEVAYVVLHRNTALPFSLSNLNSLASIRAMPERSRGATRIRSH
jgi:hypothetical protein